MSIILITGIPGSGKTLFAVSQLKKAIDKNNKLPADQQRKIYCDITGLKLPVEPPPIDWRTTPSQSLLIYDEAQFHDEFKPCRGISPYKMVEDLTIHRKTGHEIWFITQDPARLHNDILNMVEQHYHLERPYGAKLATIYQFRGVEKFAKRPTVKDRAERKLVFRYNKSLFNLYQSSQVKDGIKFRLPKTIVGYLAFIGLCFGLAGWLFSSETTQNYINSATYDAKDVKKDEKPKGDVKSLTKGETFEQIKVDDSPDKKPEFRAVAIATILNGQCVMFDSKAQVVEGDINQCIGRLRKIDYANAYRVAVASQDLQIKDKRVNPQQFYYQVKKYEETF